MPIAPLSQSVKILPKIADQGIVDLVIMFGENLSTVGKGGIFIAFVLSFGTSLGMHKLLSQVRNLGLVTNLMMMNLKYPATISLLFSKVFEFVTFDIIPTELFYPYIFDLPEGAFSDEAD